MIKMSMYVIGVEQHQISLLVDLMTVASKFGI